MLSRIGTYETPREKRRKINQAFNMAIATLNPLKEVDPADYDYLFSYLFYYARELARKESKQELNIFSQLLFVVLFDKPNPLL